MSSPDLSPQSDELDKEPLRLAMCRALTVGPVVNLGDPIARYLAYSRAEITGYSDTDDADAVRRAWIWRKLAAQSERSKVA